MSSTQRALFPNSSEHTSRNAKNLRRAPHHLIIVLFHTHTPSMFGDPLQDYRSALVPLSNVGQAPIIPENSAIPISRPNQNLPSSRPNVATPQPGRPLDRKPSSGAPRNRSPSSSTPFSELAQHGTDIITYCAKTVLTPYC